MKFYNSISTLNLQSGGKLSHFGNKWPYPKLMAKFQAVAQVVVLISLHSSFDAVYMLPVEQSFKGK